MIASIRDACELIVKPYIGFNQVTHLYLYVVALLAQIKRDIGGQWPELSLLIIMLFTSQVIHFAEVPDWCNMHNCTNLASSAPSA